MIKRFKVWNDWRKRNLNGILHHLFVLFGIIESPTFNAAYHMYDVDLTEIFHKEYKGN